MTFFLKSALGDFENGKKANWSWSDYPEIPWGEKKMLLFQEPCDLCTMSPERQTRACAWAPLEKRLVELSLKWI